MHVMIDDQRDINLFVDNTVDIDERLTIRTFDEGLKFVTHTNLSDITLLMDNDLGDVVGKEGCDIVSAFIDANNLPRTIALVSSNPVGVLRMANMIIHSGAYKKIGNIFMRLDTCS